MTKFFTDVQQAQPNLMKIVGLEKLQDESDTNIKFQIYSFNVNRMVDFSIKRTELSAEMLKKKISANDGVCPKDMNKLFLAVEEYVNSMLIQGDSSTWSVAHYKIGFRIRNGELVFLADSIYTKNGVIQSRYYGRIDLQPKGDFEEIRSMYATLIESKSVALPLSVLAAASTVLSFSNHAWDTHIYNFIVHLLGSSSTGKSTILKLVASFSGNPDAVNGFFLSYLSTSNAIIESLCDSYGHPFVIDEFSTAKKKSNWTEEVYTIANGMEKARCAAGGRMLQESTGFQGIYVSSGEISLSSKCGNNDGIMARLFEITTDYDYSDNPDNKFTTSSSESDYIKSVVTNNYGILTPLIAQALLRKSDRYNYLRQGWLNRTKQRFRTDALDLNIADRIMEYLAVIMTACEVMQDILELKFDLDRIFDYYYYHFLEKYSGDCNMDVRVYDVIKGFIGINKDRLYDSMNIFGVPRLNDDYIGYFVNLSHYENKNRHRGADGKYYDYLYMFPIDIIEDYLKGRGFEDPKTAINSLRKKKLIKYSRSGNNPKFDLPIDGVNVPMYAFWLESTEMDSMGMRGIF